ncbi:amidase [Pseudomonadales bacterium]|nr:amidase [Pseudomonadales bacterium]
MSVTWFFVVVLLLVSLVGCHDETETVTEKPLPAGQPLALVEATIADIQAAILNGSTTCEQVVTGYLARIDTYDQSLGINAITVRNSAALATARATDARLAAGETLGPLFCAPLLVKDNYDTHDMVTSGGSIALINNYPPDDAFMVRRLREAGAIIIAKTNMAEWAFSPRQTVSSSFGRTANVYDPSRVPAGSSGGTASGVAASFGVAGMGSDTGNSIRGPASHLALFGIRSTIGLTSRDGIIPLAFDRDIAGPLTRTVEDGAKIFNTIAGYDANDPLTVEGMREADYTKFLHKNGLKGARIAILGALLDTDGKDPEIASLFAAAVNDLRQAGALVLEDIDIADLSAHLNDDSFFCPRFRYDMWVYLNSLGDEAPFLDVNTLLASGQFDPTAERGLNYFKDQPLDVAPDNWQLACPTWPHHPQRNAFARDVVAAMDAQNVDILIYPSWTHPPAPIEQADAEYKGDNSQLIAPATGLPAVTVPMGFSQGKWPAGLQMLARPYAEGLLFKYAYAYEQATKHRSSPPGFAELQ